ncbi:MAG: TonB-dependent receptor, partial [Acidobacteriota bacterium]
MKNVLRILMVFFAVSVVTATGWAQSTTGALTGTVTTEGKGLPGVTVTADSPSQQGSKTAITGDNGAYLFPALAPGRYTVSFDLEGLQKVTKTATVTLAGTVRADADLKVSAVAEAITVTAAAPSVLETSQVSTHLDAKLIESLPVGRTIAQRIQLAPGVTNSGPNNQSIINGAPSFSNLYLVNGVVINDSIRGQPENLFIEDSIQETTLLTAGVSAEYGRFTGGVVSSITKSGGNQFTGSLRDNLTNDHWTKLTDFRDPVTGAAQVPNGDQLNSSYEGTLGGFILKDHLWFFGAGRSAKTSSTASTVQTNIPFQQVSDNKRYEGKLTGQITQKHSIVASYLHNNTDQINNTFGNVVDLRSLTNRSLPNWLEVGHYSGVFTQNLLLEAQYSRRYFAFVGGGGPQGDLINGTLLRDNNTSRRLWSPTFCACDPKTRNNKDYLGKATYFLSTPSFGSHSIIGGYDSFHENRHENNFQSGSNFRLWGDFVYDGQNVYFHADPVNGFLTSNPLAQLSQTSDIATNSFFINDKWDLNNRFSFNVGARYDKHDAKDQTKNPVANDSLISPRVGVIYDLTGNGRTRVSANYGRYVAAIDSGVADSVSIAGNPGSIYFNYRGPEINAFDRKTGKLLGPPVPTDQVIKMVFDWFNSVGGVTGYTNIDSIFIPGLTEEIIKGGLTSPSMDEFTGGIGQQLGANGYIKGDYIHRNWHDWYTIQRDISTGQNTAANGSKVDLGIIQNNDSGLKREYNGIQLQGALRVLERFNLGGNYTWSTLKGNVEAETFNNATVFVGNNEYPEYKKFAQNQPEGYLNEDIRHRANAWVQYDLAMPYGRLNIGLLETYHTGEPFSAVGTIDVRQNSTTLPTGVVNPGYATAPSNVPYYFAKRGGFRLDDITATNLTASYSLPISVVNFFFRGDLLNAFNEQGVENNATGVGSVVETRVYTARNAQCIQTAAGPTPGARCLRFNPFTETPKLGVHYIFDPNFGKATRSTAYQLPRTYRFTVGVRF